MTPNTFDQVRSMCREVANRAAHVRIDDKQLAPYASSLPLDKIMSPQLDPGCHFLEKNKDTVAFLLTLDTVNFGSGYFPHLQKRPGMSGYFTIAASLNDIYKKQGPLPADSLATITVEECTRIFGQDSGNKISMDLMQHFAIALNDLGRFLQVRFNGSFTGLVETAQSSAERLVQMLKNMSYFDDIESYKGLEVPFYKRAQIVAADLSLAFGGQEWGQFNDLENLTIFADNLVPHVLRIDGILIYEKSLLAKIDSGSLIPAGSAEEVEIRACAVHAVERIKQEIQNSGMRVTSSQLDNFLWNRGKQPRYKAMPRHRTQSVYY
ncbi:MAG: queuosine salvage family protein [Deltaproteobacteria bacterium]|nr:queuosine salvage family protein [Deltaproteobacteria bacterium]